MKYVLLNFKNSKPGEFSFIMGYGHDKLATGKDVVWVNIASTPCRLSLELYREGVGSLKKHVEVDIGRLEDWTKSLEIPETTKVFCEPNGSSKVIGEISKSELTSILTH